VTAEVVSGGSLGQLNERAALLKLAPTPPSYYDAQKDRVAEVAEEIGKEEVQAQWEAFSKLPFEEMVVEVDMRHDSARAAKHSTFEALAKGSHKIIFLLNVNTEEDTGNAWRNEVMGVKAFLQQCYNEHVSLRTFAHDSCSKSSALLLEYNIAMGARATKEGTQFTPCIDANDAWHGTKSWKKLWAKVMTLLTKSRLKKTATVTKTDDAISANQKEIAGRQLRAITQRVEGLLLQICNASKDRPELAIDTFRRMIYGCLIADDHSYCELVGGEDCACVVGKRVREAVNQTIPHDEAIDLDTILDEEENPYVVSERIERRMCEDTGQTKGKRSKSNEKPEVDEEGG